MSKINTFHAILIRTNKIAYTIWEIQLRHEEVQKILTLPNIKHKEGVQLPEVKIGRVSDFFAKPLVAGIELSASLKQGDKIHIQGHTTDLEMTVTSMQINNVDTAAAKAGDAVGVKVGDRVRRGDRVYKVTD